VSKHQFGATGIAGCETFCLSGTETGINSRTGSGSKPDPVPVLDPDPTKNGMIKVKEAKDPNLDDNFLHNQAASNIKN
jgi:hypothetical protein